MAEVDEPAVEVDELVGVLGEEVASGEWGWEWGVGDDWERFG